MTLLPLFTLISVSTIYALFNFTIFNPRQTTRVLISFLLNFLCVGYFYSRNPFFDESARLDLFFAESFLFNIFFLFPYEMLINHFQEDEDKVEVEEKVEEEKENQKEETSQKKKFKYHASFKRLTSNKLTPFSVVETSIFNLFEKTISQISMVDKHFVIHVESIKDFHRSCRIYYLNPRPLSRGRYRIIRCERIDNAFTYLKEKGVSFIEGRSEDENLVM